MDIYTAVGRGTPSDIEDSRLETNTSFGRDAALMHRVDTRY